jgi:NDP-sugar pyrophosphorylase family protein
LFPVERPEFFDAVELDPQGRVREIQVKDKNATSHWIWGAFKMPGRVFGELQQLWIARQRQDEYFGTLVNAYLAQGGRAVGVRAGQAYVDVGTLNGYRTAMSLLNSGTADGQPDMTSQPPGHFIEQAAVPVSGYRDILK